VTAPGISAQGLIAAHVNWQFVFPKAAGESTPADANHRPRRCSPISERLFANKDVRRPLVSAHDSAAPGADLRKFRRDR